MRAAHLNALQLSPLPSMRAEHPNAPQDACSHDLEHSGFDFVPQNRGEAKPSIVFDGGARAPPTTARLPGKFSAQRPETIMNRLEQRFGQ